MKDKKKCPKCGKKIGRTDRMKLKIMLKAIETNEKAKQEFEAVKDHCPKCIADFFKPKFKEAMSELKQTIGEKVIPDKVKGLLKKAEKEAEK